MKIAVAREKVERVLGTGSVKRHWHHKLAGAIASVVARKLNKFQYDPIDLENIAVNVSWDGRWVEIDLPKNDEQHHGDQAVATAVSDITDIFEHPELHPNL